MVVRWLKMSPDNDFPPPLDLSTLTATAVEPPPHVVPNHRAGDPSTPEPKPRNGGLRAFIDGKRETKARNVKPSRPKKSVPNIPGQFIEPLTDLYNGLAFVAMPFKPSVSMALLAPSKKPTEDNPTPLTVAENCAKAWDEAAQRSESVRRFLDSMMTASVWGGLIAAHIPLAAALLEGSSLAEKMNPATAMDAYLRRLAEHSEEDSQG